MTVILSNTFHRFGLSKVLDLVPEIIQIIVFFPYNKLTKLAVVEQKTRKLTVKTDVFVAHGLLMGHFNLESMGYFKVPYLVTGDER